MSTDIPSPTRDASTLDFGQDSEDWEDDPAPIAFRPPLVKDYTTGWFGEVWDRRKRRRKRKKLARKGYVEWYLVDSTFPRPKYIKPKLRGGGVPDYKHDGNRYIFPREAAVPNEASGMWTFVHKVGEIDPVNVRDPVEDPIPPDRLQEYFDTSLASSPASWLSKLDLDPMTLFWYGVIALVGYGVLQSAMNGGLPG